MIGVMSQEGEANVVGEFFELFKVPWEFCRGDRQYPVILSTRGDFEGGDAKLSILYNGGMTRYDASAQIDVRPLQTKRATCRYGGCELPLYGQASELAAPGCTTYAESSRGEALAIGMGGNGRKTIRAGFDLFREIRFLLQSGQPAGHARVPTLDLHIAMLRGWILGAGIPLVEVPPVPAGYDFACCLTHDIDFCGIRRHRLDHTTLGFLYRALWGSLRDALSGKCRWEKVRRNWKAALSLPAVYAGFAEDFWQPFKSYREAEKDLRSTFFVIPFREKAGSDGTNRENALRACRYDIDDIRMEVPGLLSQGCEIGVHGIDAWRDSASGRRELERIREATGGPATGIRMHWLYFGDQSARMLEEAGYAYDSTAGYNEAVGYRCGTAQVFRPVGLDGLLELPLIVQDTALFYPGRMGLTEEGAWPLIRELLENAENHGGALTLNWHDRSLAPERLWGNFYAGLVSVLRNSGAWIDTASRVVRWFAKRRTVAFGEVSFSRGKVRLHVTSEKDESVPDLVLRVYTPENDRAAGPGATAPQTKYLDVPFSNDLTAEFPI